MIQIRTHSSSCVFAFLRSHFGISFAADRTESRRSWQPRRPRLRTRGRYAWLLLRSCTTWSFCSPSKDQLGPACPDFPYQKALASHILNELFLSLHLFHGDSTDRFIMLHIHPPQRYWYTASVSPRINRSATTVSGSSLDRRPTVPASARRKVEETDWWRQGEPSRVVTAADSPLREASIRLRFLWSGKPWLGIFGKVKPRAALLPTQYKGAWNTILCSGGASAHFWYKRHLNASSLWVRVPGAVILAVGRDLMSGWDLWMVCACLPILCVRESESDPKPARPFDMRWH